ncbi:MAG: type II toxin-antitoxin system HicA family toxin [Verrucomicrobia bacterium]|nr:type II toxin-antitoxin system HicA family toxin [Verrucomicrobiota bacterium]MCH8527020.1 type II toxin-antitoxin system HicA family toxin [Kiritimatiellia bacterium]
MMPPLPVLSGKEVLAVFQKAGWEFVRQKGSHMILVKPGEIITLSVPDHKEIAKGTLRGLVRASGLTVDEFLNLR